MQYLFTFI